MIVTRIALGIDPGLNRTGWGIVEAKGNELRYIACGTIITSPKDHIALRLAHIHHNMNEVIRTYNPIICGIEETFVNNNANSSLKLGQVRGVLMLTVQLMQIPLAEYATNKVKKSVVGTGHADKNQIAMMVKQILPTANITSEDAADALAVAICHINHL